MRNKNNLTLSVIISRSQEADLTFQWAKDQLSGIGHEILLVDHWFEGYTKSRGEYICFLERDCVLGPYYFDQLLEQFMAKPSFRKLAMVAPAVGVNSYSNRVYGFRVGHLDIAPAFISASSFPYLVQVAYLPGAVIRRSAFNPVGLTIPGEDENSLIVDSVTASLNLWRGGQRVVINPDALYVTTNPLVDEPYAVGNHALQLSGVLSLFKREAVA